jgi:hypothetical protein
MEPRITETSQGVSELTSLEWSVDAIELTDKDLEKVTGAYWGHHSSIALNQAAIANARSVALNQAAIANSRGGVALNQAAIAG